MGLHTHTHALRGSKNTRAHTKATTQMHQSTFVANKRVNDHTANTVCKHTYSAKHFPSSRSLSRVTKPGYVHIYTTRAHTHTSTDAHYTTSTEAITDREKY